MPSRGSLGIVEQHIGLAGQHSQWGFISVAAINVGVLGVVGQRHLGVSQVFTILLCLLIIIE